MILYSVRPRWKIFEEPTHDLQKVLLVCRCADAMGRRTVPEEFGIAGNGQPPVSDDGADREGFSHVVLQEDHGGFARRLQTCRKVEVYGVEG